MTPVKLSHKQNIAVITVENPPVNALSHSVRQGIVDCLNQALSDASIQGIVLACRGKTFIAGADISEFGKPPLKPHLPDVLNKLQTSNKLIVAALFGTVLGGGFETALSCHYRIARTGTRVGLPEVNLGLIPGAGGTQLLPRIAGVGLALEMASTGKHQSVESIAHHGVIDRIVESDDLIEAAIRFAQEKLAEGEPLPNITLGTAEAGEVDFDAWRQRLSKRARGQLAPQRVVNSIENATTLSFSEGLKKERDMFIACRDSSQSSAMRHAFFAEKNASKLEGISPKIKPSPIHSVAVIGAGTMGQGIALCFADAGRSVTILERSEANLEKGLAAIQQQYQKQVAKGRLSEVEAATRYENIRGTCRYDTLSDIDLVIEAAFETMDVKKSIFSELDRVCKPGAILATNTSYLDIEQIAAVTDRKAQIVGMHFFSPANIMKLLEVVKTSDTSHQTLVTVMNLGKQINKISVLVGTCYGFAGNRMYASYGREANRLLLEGATPEQVDNAMTKWGMAMGPFAVNDMSGIDIAYKARKENPDLSNDPSYFKAADAMVEHGRLGRKTGSGFYRYDETGKKFHDDEAVKIIRKEAEKLGISSREISEDEIQTRLIEALISEGNHILEEGIASKASDLDTIWLNGYGFPRFRGGPMFLS